MAEFCGVMRQAARMCAQQKNSCEGCPLHDDGIECPVEGPPEGWKLNMLAEYERIVMDWVAKHPEPRYPSWSETWRRLFPDARYTPCPESEFGIKMECKGGCKECLDKPIPADIAEKLGIKPIGGSDNG